MLRLRILVLLLISILLGEVAHAQDPYYTVINKVSGLPSNSIYDLFQDSKGFIWIANNEGLTRYDGFEFKTYSSGKQTSRAGNEIKEDKYGRIWYKNFDGYLYYVEDDTLRSVNQSSTIGNLGYAIINDRLLVMQGSGIDIFDIKSLKVVRNISYKILGIEPINIISPLQYKDRYCIMTADFFYKISADGAVTKYPVNKTGIMAGAKDGIIVVNINDKDRGCYLMAEDKVMRNIAIPGVTYVHGVDYCNSLYWLFTPNGVWAYDEQGNNANNGKPLFGSKNISGILHDREGNYWFGTMDEGILFVPDIKTKLIAQHQLFPNILLAVGNTLYIGSKDNIIYTYGFKANTFEKKFEGTIPHEVSCLQADTTNGRLYFTSDKFIVADLSGNVVQKYFHAVKDIVVVDNKYCAFAATGTSGLLKVREGITSPWDSLFAATQNPENPGICELLNTGRGRTIAYNPASATIYSGSNRGLYSFTNHGRLELKMSGATIYTRKLVSLGSNVYVLTPQDQLYVIDKANTIRSIVFDNGNAKLLNLKKVGGRLFLLTSSGTMMLDTVAGKFVALDLHPGIRSEEINDIEMVNGQLVIASDRGLIALDRYTAVNDSVAPRFTINSILINGTKVAEDKLKELSHKENDIDINYSILSFNTDRRYQLFYRINEGKWQPATGITRNLKLASLSPGAYDVSFQLVSDKGKLYPQTSVVFTINKPFWTAWWFWCGCLVVFSISGYSYYKWQTSVLKKQNALVLEKVELEKNLRNSMLTSIRAQMNPHFFYNALNAIQSFIFSDDKRNASTYLVKLSRLTRMILEMSEKESIALDEETEALKLYLELEKMRFSNDFNYEVFTDSNVDSEMVKIPPMIVQPYVENAIKHGLLHKKGDKELSIKFLRNERVLSINIDDNGIGRDKAGELNQIKKEKHHPFSTYANSKRIELLNKGRSKDIGIVYIDKKDEHGMPAGTTVVISIPLI